MTGSDSLSNKVAFVQGGSRGIGAAIVKRLAAAGASLAFTYVSSANQAQALQNEIASSGGQALAIQADSADAVAVQRAVARAVEVFGRIDILINNAGVLALGSVAELPLAEFDRTLAINVRSVFVASQAVLPHMGNGGRIINISSTNAERMPFPGGATYAMSKSALTGLVKGMARDLGPRGITVNNVQPGPVDTDMNPANGEMAPGMLGFMALDRYGTTEEIAEFVAFLASPKAGYITGANLTIDGGFGA